MSAPDLSPSEGDTSPTTEPEDTVAGIPTTPVARSTTTDAPAGNQGAGPAPVLAPPPAATTRIHQPYPSLNIFNISDGRRPILRREQQELREDLRIVVGQLPRKVREAFNAVQIAASTEEVLVWNPVKLGRNVIQVYVESEADRDKLLAANDRMFCQDGKLLVAAGEEGRQELLQLMALAEKGTPRRCLTFALPKGKEETSSPLQQTEDEGEAQDGDWETTDDEE